MMYSEWEGGNCHLSRSQDLTQTIESPSSSLNLHFGMVLPKLNSNVQNFLNMQVFANILKKSKVKRIIVRERGHTWIALVKTEYFFHTFFSKDFHEQKIAFYR